jgi:hypothetical protein
VDNPEPLEPRDSFNNNSTQNGNTTAVLELAQATGLFQQTVMLEDRYESVANSANITTEACRLGVAGECRASIR